MIGDLAFRRKASPESVADAGDQEVDSSADATTLEPESGGGLSDNIGIVVLGVAGLLILLAGAGVYLLRRG